jgi:hypothetical protein
MTQGSTGSARVRGRVPHVGHVHGLQRLRFAFASLVALLVITFGASAADEPSVSRRPAATPSPTATPEPSDVSPFADPTPTPAPVSRRLVGALDIEQGEGGERTALFADGTLVHVVRFKGRRTTTRRVVSNEELAVISRVLAEALTAREEKADERRSVLTADTVRRLRLEVADSGDVVRSFVFDDVDALPQPVGRAKAAMDDLRSRFLVRDTQKDELWDASRLVEGSVLKRRGDGRRFRIVRDDAFEGNVEVQEIEGNGLRFFVKREDLPKSFEAPLDEPGETVR